MATAVGSEILVNTTTLRQQYDPTVATFADGRFVVAWADDSASGGDTSATAIRAQIFNADGTKFWSEFLVNSTTSSYQDEPAITALPDGRFVVAFRDISGTGGDISSAGIRARIFNADGTTSTSDFLVNTTTFDAQELPTITALPDGHFVVAWRDYSQTGGDRSSTAVRGQVFNPDGSKSGGEFLGNTTTAGPQEEPTIAGLADGRFVVAWTDSSASGGDTSSSAIRAQLFNPDGSKSGSEFLVNTTTLHQQYQPTVTGLPDGGFVVAWTDGSDFSTSKNIRAQVFNADGSLSGDEFVVNTTLPNHQDRSTIAAWHDGHFVVAWTDFSQTGGDTSSLAIRAQIFAAGDVAPVAQDGAASGNEDTVMTGTL